MKKIIVFVFFALNTFCLSANDKGYYSFFENRFDGSEVFKEYYNEFDNGTIIIYSNELNNNNAINNLSNSWILSLGIQPTLLKNTLKNSSEQHISNNVAISLTAQSIYIEEIHKVFCIIYDRKGIIINPKNQQDRFLTAHEIEHCYINTILSPIFLYDEVEPYFPEMMAISERKYFYNLYNHYIQEIFADLSAINKLGKSYIEHLRQLRGQLLKHGDYFHDSRIFLTEIMNTYNSYAHKDIGRQNILQFLSLNAMDIVPITAFINSINNNKNIKPTIK